MFLVDGDKFGLEIGRNPVGEFLYGVYTGGFQPPAPSLPGCILYSTLQQ